MTSDKGQSENSDDKPRKTPPADVEGDLGFAEAEQTAADIAAEAAAHEAAESLWTPSPRLDDDQQSENDDRSSKPETDADSSATGQSAKGGGAKSVEDTWVPVDDGAENTDAPTKGMADTWVPSDDGAESTTNDDADSMADDSDEVASLQDTWTPDQVDDPVDPDKTWMPSDTPTIHGLNSEESNSEDTDSVADEIDPGKTLVPEDVDSAEEVDPDKTWVPSNTPTVHGLNGDDDSDPIDPDKTWTPSDTPTHHDFSFDSSTEDDESTGKDDPFDKTIAVDSGGSPTGDTPDSDPGFGTVVMEGEGVPGTDSSAGATLPGTPELGTDKTQIFSKTMGMRGLSEGDNDEWQAEIAEKNVNDTVALDDAPADVSDSSRGRGTQIWSKQSADGLDMSLTIRSRPVAGDGQFESKVKSDQPDYQIVEKLAEGGMGAIYIATQTSLDRELAIKTLKPLRDSEKRNYTRQGRMSQVMRQRREMFLSEALVTANLVHPHIIPIHDLCQTVDGSPFYSMKRVIGTPWNERITEMPLEDNLEVLHKVCDAVAYAHHNGVVNRDLKPENIMLGEFGEVLVLDWGLAVPSTTDDRKRFASPSASFGAGTPAYMSPELWAGPPDSIGTWSDVYLMGAILFEMITGKAPHTFPEPDSKAGNSGLWKIIDNVVRRNEIRESEVTGELMDIAMKAMSSERKDRHHSVIEFQEAIKGFQKHEESRRLALRATETLDRNDRRQGDRRAVPRDEPNRRQGYQDFQTATALYEEACNAWPENHDAKIQLRQARLGYAELAHVKGDYDLGLQIAEQEQGTEFTALSQKLTRARTIRNGLKYAMTVAAGIIVLVGAISFYQAVKISQQNDEIVALYGDKQTLETEKEQAETAKADAERASRAAIAAKAQAEEDRLVAENARKDVEEQRLTAVREKAVADAARTEAEKLTAVAVKAKAAADESRLAAQQEAQKAVEQQRIAVKAQQKADQQRMLAVREKANAEKQLTAVTMEVARVEKQKIRAKVDLQNAEIANLIRNADYSGALRGVQQLLAALDEDPELGNLPASERNQRIQELKARQVQLLKRTRPTDVPVQTQVISPSGNTIVWGDAEGELTVWKMDATTGELAKEEFASLNINSAVSTVRISADESLIVAATKNLIHVWRPEDNSHQILKGHLAAVNTLVLAETFLLAADASGSIRSWDLATQQERWSIRSSAAIRDLALLPDSGIFLYAGSRGGESADVLAYQLPPESDPGQRPKRLGQLRLPRDRNNPPRRMTVSPDEQLLLISNSRNGELLVLPRRDDADMTGRDRFPFEHAADLDADDATGWMLSHHQRPINDIIFSQNGQRVATASDDRSIGVLQRTDDGLRLVQRLEGHGARVNAAGFLDVEGSRVLSASADRFCRFWDVSQYEHNRRTLEKTFNLSSLLLPTQVSTPAAAQRNYILAKAPLAKERSPNFSQAPAEADYRIVNADSELQRGAIKSAAISHDGTQLVTGAADGTAVIWDTSTGQPITGMSTRSRFELDTGSFEEGHDFNVSKLRFLPPAGNVLLTTGFDGNLCMWNADIRKASAGTQELRITGLGLVNAVATSADGKLIVTSAAASAEQRAGSATVWNTADLLRDGTPEPVAVLNGFHRGEISAVAISPDGAKVATGARDGRVAIWSVSAAELIAGSRIHVKNTIVSHLEWLSNDRLLSAGFDGRLMITTPGSDEAESPKLEIVANFQHDRIPVERVTCSPDCRQFVTISIRTDKATKASTFELQLWDISSLTPLKRLQPAAVEGVEPKRIAAVHWSPLGTKLVAVVDGHLQVFDTSTWRIRRVLEAPGLGISDAVFAPRPASAVDNGDVIATFDGTAAHVWNLDNRSHIADFRPLFAVQATALSSDETSPLLLTGERAVRVFQANQSADDFGQTLFKISNPHRGVITSLQFAPESNPQVFVSGGADGSVTTWTWDPDALRATLRKRIRRSGSAISATAWSPDGQQLLLATDDGHVSIVNADNPDQTVTDFVVEDGRTVTLSSAAFSSDGRFFAVGGKLALSGESVAWVFDATGQKTPDLHCQIRGHEAGGVTCLAFLNDSPYLVTGGADGAALIWNWQPQRSAEGPLQAYEAYQLLVDGKPVAHDAPVTSVAVSAATKLATSSDDGTAIIWNNPFRR